jgi:outer membrane protein, heavy metal efflux system
VTGRSKGTRMDLAKLLAAPARRLLVGACCALPVVAAAAQTAPPASAAGPDEPITFRAFLAEVAASNLDYAAARYNVSIAQAQVLAAQVSPNPSVTAGRSGQDVTDQGDQREPANNDLSLSQTIELGGKRGKRVAVAKANLAQAAATAEDFFRTLRGNAATAYIDALTKRREAAEKQRSAGSLDELVTANRKRLEVGDIGEIDLTQSRVDAMQARGDYLAAESDARVAVIGLEQLLGRKRPLGVLVPAGTLDGPPRTFDQDALLEAALEHRPDVIAARHALASARANVEVARAMAIPDVTVDLTYQDNEASMNRVAPAPAFSSIGLSLSLPLPIFNRYRGELESARQTAEQSETTLRSAELGARVAVLQALARYQLANARAEQYRGGAIDDAAAVLFSYAHGASTLLDVLNAQTAENQVRLAYLDALDERAKALVGLEEAAGIWDVDF